MDKIDNDRTLQYVVYLVIFRLQVVNVSHQWIPLLGRG